MDEIHIHQAPDPSLDVDEVITMTFVKNTLGIFRDRGLTPAQSIFKLLGPLPHQPLENVSWTAAECILFWKSNAFVNCVAHTEIHFLNYRKDTE